MSIQDNAGMNIEIKPIGVIRNEKKEPSSPGWEEGTVSDIILDASLGALTEGLEEFSHIMVVFWMHKLREEPGIPEKVHPRGRQDLPLVGLFATRAPIRPNPLGISVVKLVECRGNILTVEGLDAIDGTPVIDIKPYLPGNEVQDASFPDWVYKL